MRVCLVRGPTFVQNETVYPYNIECIATELRAHNHKVFLVDAELIARQEVVRRRSEGLFGEVVNKFFVKRQVEKQKGIVASLFSKPDAPLWDNIACKILSYKPDIIGLSCYSASMSSSALIVKHLRHKYRSKIPIVLGGIHPTSAPIEVLTKIPEVDYVVVGEGEKAIIELIKLLDENGSQISQVKGIGYRLNGNNLLTERRNLIMDLSSLSIPTFDYAGPHYQNYVIITSRGCPYNCDFCASKVIWGQRVRYRPPSHVIQEIINLKKKVNIRYLRFGDDTFTLNKKHMISIADGLRKAKVNDIAFSVGSRIDTIDKEKLEILKNMGGRGVYQISFGIETGSERLMMSNNKNINLRNVIPKIRMINDAGIYTNTFFILNHPGETLVDMQATISLIKELMKYCKLNTISLNIGFPYPATPWWNYCEDRSFTSNIDFYRYSHEYNHQQISKINMTEETLSTVSEMNGLVERILLMNDIKVRTRKAFKMILRDPGRVLSKILK